MLVFHSKCINHFYNNCNVQIVKGTEESGKKKQQKELLNFICTLINETFAVYLSADIYAVQNHSAN